MSALVEGSVVLEHKRVSMLLPFSAAKVNLNQQSNEPPDFLAALWGCNEKDWVLTSFTNILLNKYSTISLGSLCFPLLQMALLCCVIERKMLCSGKERKKGLLH